MWEHPLIFGNSPTRMATMLRMSGPFGSTAVPSRVAETICTDLTLARMVFLLVQRCLCSANPPAWQWEDLQVGAAHIYRARPDGSQLEVVITGGMNNPVGLAFSEAGNAFLAVPSLICPSRAGGTVSCTQYMGEPMVDAMTAFSLLTQVLELCCLFSRKWDPQLPRGLSCRGAMPWA